jgi:hypothetical protein
VLYCLSLTDGLGLLSLKFFFFSYSLKLLQQIFVYLCDSYDLTFVTLLQLWSKSDWYFFGGCSPKWSFWAWY